MSSPITVPSSPVHVDISSALVPPPVVVPSVPDTVSLFPLPIDISNIFMDISYTNIKISNDVDIHFSSNVLSSISPIDISNILLFPSDVSLNYYDVSFANGLGIVHESGEKADGTKVSQTTAFTVDPSKNFQIFIDLSSSIQQYNDEVDVSINSIMQEITSYASKIQCTDFQGKGTIDDYTELFTVASQLAKEAKQTSLNINIDGFKDFGNAADELSAVFQSYIMKIENINVIKDTNFLQEILFYLKKIWNLSETFGKFKDTILGTSLIKIPKSLEDTKNVIDGVMTEVDCAMKYIQCFISPESVVDISLCNCGTNELSISEKEQIAAAVNTIKNWNHVYNQDVHYALSSNTDVQFIKEANQIMKNTTNTLKNSTSIFKGKLLVYKNK